MPDIPNYASPPYADFEWPATRAALMSRLFPALTFYGRVSWIVISASIKARKGRYHDADWYGSSVAVREALKLAGATISVKGTEHVAGLKGPCVIIGNHMSTAETFLLPSILRPFRDVTFVVKQSLVQYPVFKHVMLSRNPIVVGRVNPREDLKAVFDGGQERLKAGISIIIFPQRTRRLEFDRESFNTIGVKLAKRAGVPVIPLALKTNAWGNGSLIKDYGPVRPEEPVKFEFGAPLTIEGNDHPVHQAVVEFIESRLRSWGMPVAETGADS
ncbi:MAG TPA: lysophospholipid acyltransferase family protein [Oceanipulchritudo sp.]|nr:lysophospholipid acyltransferase family protein [Oceanipulchritudo sp.]